MLRKVGTSDSSILDKTRIRPLVSIVCMFTNAEMDIEHQGQFRDDHYNPELGSRKNGKLFYLDYLFNYLFIYYLD